MKVALFGANGGMGRRYATILKSLNHEILPVEVCTDWEDVRAAVLAAEKAIVATPTPNHLSALIEINHLRHALPKLDVLCEKPLVTEERELEGVAALSDITPYVVNQYAYLTHSREEGKLSWYNYFNHGRDGLIWDCFQIVGLARGPLELREDSYIWGCGINGFPLHLVSMDWAYGEMIKDFMGPKLYLWDLKRATEITRKVMSLL